MSDARSPFGASMALIWSIMFAIAAAILFVVAMAAPAGVAKLALFVGVVVLASLFVAFAVYRRGQG